MSNASDDRPGSYIAEYNAARRQLAAGDTHGAAHSFAGLVERYEDRLGPEDLIELLLATADAERQTGKLSRARHLTEQALERAAALDDPEAHGKVQALNDLAVQYHYEGDWDRAAHFYQGAIAACKKRQRPESSPHLATTLANLATLKSRHEQDFTTADALLRRAVAAGEAYGGPERTSILAAVTEMLGRHLNEIGRHEEAATAFSNLVEYQTETHGHRSIAVADTRRSIASQYQQIGDYATALDHLASANSIYSEWGLTDHPRSVPNLTLMAAIHLRLQNHNYCIDLCHRIEFILDAHEIIDDRPTDHLTTMATALGALGSCDEQLATLDSLLETTKRRRGSRSRDYAQVCYHRGMSHLDAGNPGAALEDLRAARKLRAELIGRRSFDYANALNSEGIALGLLGDLEGERQTLTKAVEAFEAAGQQGHPTFGSALSNLAIATARAGNVEKALDLMDRVAPIDDLAIRRSYLAGSHESTIGYLAKLRAETAIYVSMIAHADRREGPIVDRAAARVKRYKAIDLELESKLASVLDEVHQRAALENIRRLELEILSLAAAPDATDGGRRLWSLRHELEAALIALSNELKQIDGEPHPADLGIGLGVEGAIIDYVAFPRLVGEPDMRLGCFVFRERKPSRFLELGSMLEALTAANELYESLTGDQFALAPSTSTAAAIARARALLLDPLRDYLSGINRMVVCVEAGLERVPFRLLVRGSGNATANEPLVTYAAASREMYRRASDEAGPGPTNAASSSQSKGAVFACPAYTVHGPEQRDTLPNAPANDNTSGQHDDTVPGIVQTAISRAGPASTRLFRSLPGSSAEGQSVRDLTGARLFRGSDATKAAVQALKSPIFLHFATHGFYLPWPATIDPSTPWSATLANPNYRCGLALAGSDGFWSKHDHTSLDGILTAADAARLDLVGTLLVTVSACESAIGGAELGEAIYGMHRAFRVAGAACVVGSLWPVDDQSTRRLMWYFYHHLVAGESVGRALQLAQDDVSDATPIVDWIGFIAIGDTDVTVPFRSIERR